MTIDNSQPKPVTDISRNAVSIARALDRLPPGEYVVTLVKPDPGIQWVYEVHATTAVVTRRLTVRDG